MVFFFSMQTKDIRKHLEHMIAQWCLARKSGRGNFAFVMCDY